MVLILTLLARDEVDIIKGMIDFHLTNSVDYIIVTDNGSTDGTFEICREYEKKGRVMLLSEPPSDYSKHRWVSRMANIAYDKYHADWVIHADADELFLPAQQHHNLKDSLKKIPEHISVLHIPRHDFVPIERPMKESPLIEMIFRKTVSLNLRGVPLPPKAVHRGSPNVIISQGNHSARGDYLNKPVLTRELSVYHYPLRSYKQFYRKVNNAGSGYLINTELNPNIGFHKRYWYDLLLNDKLRDLYYDEYLFTSEKFEDAIKRHEIIEDRRVANFFRLLYSDR